MTDLTPILPWKFDFSWSYDTSNQKSKIFSPGCDQLQLWMWKIKDKQLFFLSKKSVQKKPEIVGISRIIVNVTRDFISDTVVPMPDFL